MTLPKTELKMAQYILENECVHYSDLVKEFKISRPTVTKYLNQLTERIDNYDINIQLKRDRSIGIRFEGDLDKLNTVFNENADNVVPDTPEDRQMFIIATLIFNKSRVSISQLSEQLYVSRRTIESDLTKVRSFIAENGGQLVTNNGSLSVVLPDKIKYPFLIDVIHQFWGNKLMTSSHENVLFPPILDSYFKQSETKKVFKIVDVFISQHSYNLTDYEYETLIIYLILQLSLSSKSSYDKSPTPLENETIELSHDFNKAFNYQLNVEQLIYLNNFIILIKLENHKEINHDDDFLNLKDDIKKILSNDFDEQLIEGLYQHLSGSLRRAKFGMNINNPYTEQIKIKFPLSFEEALNLITKLEQRLQIKLNEDEVAFTALHFESYFERRRTPDAPVSAVIVCNTGIGTSRLLEEKINQNMRNAINVERVLRSHEVNNSNINEDLIISTIPLTNIEKPCVIVSPFLTDKDKEKIKKVIQNINSQNESFDYFTELFDTNLIIIEEEKLGYAQAISKLTRESINNSYANIGIEESAMNREQVSSTAVEKIALPHADTKFIKKPFIAVMVAKNGISWMTENVKIVFFMGMNDQVSPYIRKIYHYLNEIIDDKEKIYELENAQSTTEILNIITGEK
ncbi:PTS sugar transporter [Companilactobacillus sp. RD055328]|uniref:BglG family transcription antiterminator n=1 Tax=Companilactobacillus sp. RD055328 TaxID=2916634 RepID=UPI001FC7F515|nr:PTS sugar transporter subunit IIA [Companilactobacillus sp. RD055328]GKQ42143.1 PTS sugar transporter [Companilactobacillus sp. RD055328]